MNKTIGFLFLAALLAAACAPANSEGASTGSLSAGGPVLTVNGPTLAAPDLQNEELPARPSSEGRTSAPPPPPEPRTVINSPAVESRPGFHDRCSVGVAAHGKVKPMLPMCMPE